MKRKTIFAIAVMFFISLDMLSTWFLVESGYRELTGLIVLFLDISYLALIVWVLLWGALIYFGDSLFKRLEILTHVETIIILTSFYSLLAFIGNMYLYLK